MTVAIARTRPRGFITWAPSADTAVIVAAVKAVIEEYREHLPLTLRQIFYRLVATRDYAKDDRSYKRLGEILNRARRARLIPFSVIRDDGVTVETPLAWDGVQDFCDTVAVSAKTFRLDRQRDQPVRLVIAVEAAGMVPQVARVAEEFGVPVHSSGGFDSVTAKHALACSLSRWPACEVLHIGDHDPSGVHVFGALDGDVTAFVQGLANGHAAHVKFTRLAVTREHIDALGLPTAPPKATDRRRFDDSVTVQAEAIPPDRLAQIIRDAIVSRFNANAYEAVLAEEHEHRAQLQQRFGPMRTGT